MRRGSYAKLGVIVLSVVCSLFATGCWDRIELEEMAFAPVMAIDEGPGNTLLYTIRVSIPRALAGGNGGGGGGGGSDVDQGGKVVTVQARTLGEAINVFNSTVERKLSFQQCQAVFFGEALSKKGILPVVQELLRYREIRRTTFVLIAKGKAMDALKEHKPVLENNVSRYIEDIHEIGEYTGMSPTIHLHTFVTALEEPHEDPYTGLLAINEAVKKEEEAKKAKEKGGGSSQAGGQAEGGNEGEKKFDAKAINSTAGELQRSGGNPQEFTGAAVFHKDKMVGLLNGQEAMILQSMHGELKHGFLTFPDPDKRNSFFTLEMRQRGRPEVQFELGGLRPKLFVPIHFEADLFTTQNTGAAVDTPAQLRKLESAAELSIRKQAQSLIQKAQTQYHAEPFGFGDQLRRHFLTYRQFRDYDWQTAFEKANIDVQVKVKIRRIGVLLVPAKAEQ